MAALPDSLRRAARDLAAVLVGAGHEAWIVGGAVRDLAFGDTPREVDIATDALPERVEALFPGSVGVGRAFGTMIVPWLGPGGEREGIEVTTFRSEDGYSDARRPDTVRFGSTLEEDARRRDFTLNALYLDPLSDEVRDPEGGLADLAARRLRTVGDPDERLAEDALRLLRLARFAGRFDLDVDPDTAAAAGRNARRFDAISRERVGHEWRRACAHLGFGRVVATAASVDLLVHAAPGSEARWEQRVRLVESVEASHGLLGPELGFALLFDPLQPFAPSILADATRGLESLRPSRNELRAAQDLWHGLVQIAALPAARLRRAAAVRIARREDAERLLGYAAERAAQLGWPDRDAVDGVRTLRTSERPERLRPDPLLDGSDLRAHGLDPGPRFGELLREAEDLQLEGELTTRDDAVAWLAGRLGR